MQHLPLISYFRYLQLYLEALFGEMDRVVDESPLDPERTCRSRGSRTKSLTAENRHQRMARCIGHKSNRERHGRESPTIRKPAKTLGPERQKAPTFVGALSYWRSERDSNPR